MPTVTASAHQQWTHTIQTWWCVNSVNTETTHVLLRLSSDRCQCSKRLLCFISLQSLMWIAHPAVQSQQPTKQASSCCHTQLLTTRQQFTSCHFLKNHSYVGIFQCLYTPFATSEIKMNCYKTNVPFVSIYITWQITQYSSFWSQLLQYFSRVSLSQPTALFKLRIRVNPPLLHTASRYVYNCYLINVVNVYSYMWNDMHLPL